VCTDQSSASVEIKSGHLNWAIWVTGEEKRAYGEEAATKAVELPYELPAEAGDHLRAAALGIDGCTQ
jgi:hypothetical protein